MAKISVSIPDDVLEQVTAVAGKGGVSAYLTESALKRVRKQLLLEYLDEQLEANGGPITPEEIAEARRWRESSLTRARSSRRNDATVGS